MALTPLDIHHKEFKTARFGGYNEEEVDSFLDQVADEFEKLIQEDVELKQQIEHSKKRLSEFEEMQTSLQSALLAATKSAEAVKDQARQESEALVGKAQEEADSMVRSAQEQARQMILRAQSERQKMERSFVRLKETKQSYLRSIRDLAEAHLSQVSDIESREEDDMAVEDFPQPDEKAEPVVVKTPPLIEEPIEEPPPAMPAQEPPEAKTVTEKPPEKPPTDVPESVGEDSSGGAGPAVLAEAPEHDKAAPAKDAPPPVASSSTGGVEAGAPLKSSTAVSLKEEQSAKAPPSSTLVDEVLAMDNGEDIYGEIVDEMKDQVRESGRKTRKEKRDKHFFWE